MRRGIRDSIMSVLSAAEGHDHDSSSKSHGESQSEHELLFGDFDDADHHIAAESPCHSHVSRDTMQQQTSEDTNESLTRGVGTGKFLFFTELT